MSDATSWSGTPRTGRTPSWPAEGTGEDDADEWWTGSAAFLPDRVGRRRGTGRAQRRAALGREPFTVLSDPVRRDIVELLCRVGATTSGDVAQTLYEFRGVGWSSVSRHLAVLEASGFAWCHEVPPHRFWYLADDWLDLLRAALVEWERHWEAGVGLRRLSSVADLVDTGALPGASGVEPAAAPALPGRASRGRRGRDRSALGDGRSHDHPDADGGYGTD